MMKKLALYQTNILNIQMEKHKMEIIKYYIILHKINYSTKVIILI